MYVNLGRAIKILPLLVEESHTTSVLCIYLGKLSLFWFSLSFLKEKIVLNATTGCDS